MRKDEKNLGVGRKEHGDEPDLHIPFAARSLTNGIRSMSTSMLLCTFVASG